MHCSVFPRPISSAKMAPWYCDFRMPITHSYMNTMPSLWCGRRTRARHMSTTTSTTGRWARLYFHYRNTQSNIKTFLYPLQWPVFWKQNISETVICHSKRRKDWKNSRRARCCMHYRSVVFPVIPVPQLSGYQCICNHQSNLDISCNKYK